MKKLLIKIAIGVVFMIAGWQIASYGDKVVSKATLEEMEIFCQNAATAQGNLQGEYNEITVKIGKISTKMYEFTYDFEADGRSYTSKRTTNTTTSADAAQIWYDKSNPSKNATNNPCTELERTKKEKTVGGKGYYYISGGLFLLIGFGLAWGSFKQILASLFSSKKKQAVG